MLRNLWRWTARWRSWLWNVFTVAFTGLLLALATPEVQAVLPKNWLPWALALNAVVNLWMRPRPAVLADDIEAHNSRSRR